MAAGHSTPLVTALLSFASSEPAQRFAAARDLTAPPRAEALDAQPFSFAFSGRHDGGALQLPPPPPEDATRAATHAHYAHTLDALLESKRLVDAAISPVVAAAAAAAAASAPPAVQRPAKKSRRGSPALAVAGPGLGPGQRGGLGAGDGAQAEGGNAEGAEDESGSVAGAGRDGDAAMGSFGVDDAEGEGGDAAGGGGHGGDDDDDGAT